MGADERLDLRVVDGVGIDDAKAREIVQAAGFDEAEQAAIAPILTTLWDVYREEDATLVEVNPLVKTADGQMLCTDGVGTCFRLDASGKELKQFAMPNFIGRGAAPALVGNIDVTPKGTIVIAHANSVEEYDANGNVVWKAAVAGTRATRLANGNTLVASETDGVIEVNSAGKTVWHYQPPTGYHAVRARQMGNGLMPTQVGGR